jgi:hypothetical protein
MIGAKEEKSTRYLKLAFQPQLVISSFKSKLFFLRPPRGSCPLLLQWIVEKCVQLTSVLGR